MFSAISCGIIRGPEIRGVMNNFVTMRSCMRLDFHDKDINI